MLLSTNHGLYSLGQYTSPTMLKEKSLMFAWLTLLCCLGMARSKGFGTSQCHILTEKDHHFVEAFQMHYLPGKGCHYNNSTHTNQQVHVISLKLESRDSNLRPQIVFNLEPKEFTSSVSENVSGSELPEKQLIFVLNSVQPVRWKVEVSHKFHARTRYLFILPRHSDIRFKRRRMQERKRRLPSPKDPRQFLHYVQRMFKAVTSYSEVDGKNLLFYVGQAEVTATGSGCHLNKLKPSPYAYTAQLERQPVTGCVSSLSQNVLERPVYIIELQSVPPPALSSSSTAQEDHGIVELDLMPAGHEKMEHDFYLVLKSPKNLKWMLRSHRLQGWIDVVTDADVDLRGVRMHTVALRREEEEASGMDLIRWAEFYIAPVRSYTAIASANKVQLLLQSDEKKKEKVGVDSKSTSGSNHHRPESRPSNDMLTHLQNIIKTRCEGDVMEVTLPTYLTQARVQPQHLITFPSIACFMYTR